MRHLKSNRKLGMSPSHRKAMFRNMVTSLMLHGQIRTTEKRAKELRRIAERLITLGKRVPPSALASLQGDELAAARAKRVHAIRQVRRWVNDRDALDRVFNEYAERYKSRPGGYTRLTKVGFRTGDNAPMNMVELLREPMSVDDTDAEVSPALEVAEDELDQVEAAAAEAAEE